MAGLRVSSAVDGVQGTSLYTAIDASGAPIPGPRVGLVGMVHGNETVGGKLLDDLGEILAGGLVAGEVLAVRANLRAADLGTRHTPDGTDLNRLWHPERLAEIVDRGPACYEEGRVIELAPLLARCDAILDLHSTTRPSPAFLIFRDDQRHALVARALGVELLVTGLYERAILDGGMCQDVGLSWGDSSPRLGFTLEAGQHSDPSNLRRAEAVVVRLLHALGLWGDALFDEGPRTRVYEVTDSFRQAPAGTPQWRFVGHVGGEPGGGRRGAPRRLASFEEVQADEVLLRRGDTGVARTQAPFTILLPTPHARPGEDLYYTARRRRGGVAEGEEPRDDAQARREALAVERVLDQLDADAFERGTSWASFDPRHVLDLCAALVVRALRLPAGHPHRRLSLVGRGGSGDTEGERRAGRRYRSAMRRAMAEGVPLERVQLLRGASLEWLESLTGPAMAALLRTRRGGRPDAEDPLRLYLSVRQPHTVSMLVVGDLDRALEDGDARHVRVVLLVEAATVEPDRASAVVRIVRGGLVSSRPEILRAAQRLLRGLVEEHRLLVDLPPLGDAPALTELMGRDGGLMLPSDPRLRGELAEALREVLVHQWREPLARVVRPAELVEAEDVGRWLAATMRASGVLDPSTLSALLLRDRAGGGWEVDPSGLRGIHAVRSEPRPARWVPDAPLLASEVDADGLQRWLSWKRWLHDGRVIPDTRGKDLDLALSEGDIRARVARWFEDARALARSRSEEVLVVVAGDGLSAERDANGAAVELLAAHDRLLLDPAVRYLRIQHLSGAHLGWLKHLGRTMARRPGGQAVAVQWEDEHGASVNVVVVAVRERADPDAASTWSLDGWSIQRCGVVLSDLHASTSRDYAMGLFTEPTPGSGTVHQELVAFARAHCEGLIGQGGARALGPRAFEDTLVERISRWVERARRWREALVPPPEDLEERAAWVADWLGLADASFAVELADEVHGDAPPALAAARIWGDVEPWPRRSGGTAPPKEPGTV